MTIPTGDVMIPAIVVRIAAGRTVKAVWNNDIGGRTFQVGTGACREFVKVTALSSAPGLLVEADRLVWAAPYLAVPDRRSVGRSGRRDAVVGLELTADGVTPDPVRIDYYRRLWSAGDQDPPDLPDFGEPPGSG